MRSDFDTVSRIFAFPISELARIGELVTLYGADLPDVPQRPESTATRCIVGGLDREGSDDLRSLDHPATATTTELTDGRHAYAGYWSNAILAALNASEVTGEEITAEQLESLRIPYPDL